MKKIKRLIKKIVDYAIYIYSKATGAIPVNYYNRIPNVGDALNPYLINKITGKKVFCCNAVNKPILTAVGSMLQSTYPEHLVWGTGIMSDEFSCNISNPKNLYALRGHRTKAFLEQKLGVVLNVPLGDPAVLMSEFYKPDNEHKTFDLGIVPHYMDRDSKFLKEALERGAHIIDVGIGIEEFVNQINNCKRIISSSMHGLILSDTYNIPNLWLSMSNKISGGTFKFLDYYSTTDYVKEQIVWNDGDIELIEKLFMDNNLYRVSHYIGNKEELKNSIPQF